MVDKAPRVESTAAQEKAVLEFVVAHEFFYPLLLGCKCSMSNYPLFPWKDLNIETVFRFGGF